MAAFLCVVDAAEQRTEISNGRPDRNGRFVFVTRNIAPDQRPIGSFFQYSTQHGVRRLALPAIAQPGAICFSPDGGTMYFADTARNGLFAVTYDSERAATRRNIYGITKT